MKKIAPAVILLISFALSLFVTPVKAEGERYVYVFSGSLYLRDAASSNGAVLKNMKYGNRLTVIDSSSSTWWKVATADGMIGWAAKSYMGYSVYDMDTDSVIQVTSSKITLRSEPSGTSKVVRTLSKDTFLLLLDNTSSKIWAKVRDGAGNEGWVGAVYVGVLLNGKILPNKLPVDKKYIVYWGNTGTKIHIQPECRTIKNGVISGTLSECKAAGHTDGWCQVCSKGWSDERFQKEGNPYAEHH